MVSSAIAFQLITPDEAALPAGTLPSIELRGSPTRRPSVVIVVPPPTAGVIESPLDLKIEFRAYGGAEIDPASVVVTYLKEPRIDITHRIAQFITKSGIEVVKVEVPPGRHDFWVELKDKEGRIGGAAFSFQVAQ